MHQPYEQIAFRVNERCAQLQAERQHDALVDQARAGVPRRGQGWQVQFSKGMAAWKKIMESPARTTGWRAQLARRQLTSVSQGETATGSVQ